MLKRIAGVAAGSGLAMLVSGCGMVPGLGGPDPIEVVNGLAKKTEDVKSYKATMSFAEGGVGDMDMEYTKKPKPTIKMNTEYQGNKSTMLLRNDELLMDASSMGGMAPGGAEWLRIENSDSEMDLQAQDPIAEVEKMLAAKDVSEEGEETVDGTATTKYTGSYSVEEALSEIDDKKSKKFAKNYYDDKNIDSIDFKVWVDDDGLPRRVDSKGGSDFDTTLKFTEFNEPVDIDYPSESQISSMDDLTNGMDGMDGTDPGGGY